MEDCTVTDIILHMNLQNLMLLIMQGTLRDLVTIFSRYQKILKPFYYNDHISKPFTIIVFN